MASAMLMSAGVVFSTGGGGGSCSGAPPQELAFSHSATTDLASPQSVFQVYVRLNWPASVPDAKI
jgi:hypothetical protein